MDRVAWPGPSLAETSASFGLWTSHEKRQRCFEGAQSSRSPWWGGISSFPQLPINTLMG